MVYGGLGNLGLTCAINTLIQCITHTPVLRKFFLQNIFNENTLAYQLKDVIELLYVKNVTVAPKGFLNKLFTTFPDILHFGEQHDLCELWMLISDKIADEIGQPIPPPPKKLEDDPNNLDNKIHHMIYNCNNKKMSKFVENIQGIQISILQCNNTVCHEQYYNPEVFTTMMVDIPSLSSYSHSHYKTDLINLLLDFYKIEDLASDTWKCDKCEKQNGARKQSKLLKMPRVLIVVLKRFLMTETGNFRKITDPVDISADLEFGFDNKTFKYSLCAMGNHLGSYNGGHYNAITRTKVTDNTRYNTNQSQNSQNSQNKQDNQYEWTCYDDTTCYTMKNSYNDILANNKEAYILFYQIVLD